MGFFLNIKVIQQQTDSTTKRSLKKKWCSTNNHCK